MEVQHLRTLISVMMMNVGSLAPRPNNQVWLILAKWVPRLNCMQQPFSSFRGDILVLYCYPLAF